MNRMPLESSNVLSAGYDEESKTLEVEFAGNRIYQYFNVGKIYYENLISCPDVGWYFNHIIRPFFSNYVLLEE